MAIVEDSYVGIAFWYPFLTTSVAIYHLNIGV